MSLYLVYNYANIYVFNNWSYGCKVQFDRPYMNKINCKLWLHIKFRLLFCSILHINCTEDLIKNVIQFYRVNDLGFSGKNKPSL